MLAQMYEFYSQRNDGRCVGGLWGGIYRAHKSEDGIDLLSDRCIYCKMEARRGKTRVCFSCSRPRKHCQVSFSAVPKKRGWIMKIIIITALLLALSVGVVFAQGGSITLSAIPDQPFDCDIIDFAPGLVTVYLIHMYTPGAMGARFMVEYGADVAMTYLGEEMNYVVESGNALTGITVCYEACLSSPIVIGEILYFGHGLSAPCSYMSVEPHPEASWLEVLDCEMNVVYGTGGIAIVNSDGGCYCDLPPVYPSAPGNDRGTSSKTSNPPFCATVPVHQSPWGQIKALYAR